MSTMLTADSQMLKMPGLDFDELSHTYKLEGTVIPSVSRVMDILRKEYYQGISERTLEKAANKGSIVHNGIENWIKFDIDDIPNEYHGYFDGFLEWWEKNKPVVVASELRVYHKLLRYGGTLDLLCYIDGKLVLIDYKSTWNLSEMLCRVQLQAYEEALASHGIRVDEKRILHLKRDGKWKDPVFEAKDAIAWRVFGSLKSVFDYMESYKK